MALSIYFNDKVRLSEDIVEIVGSSLASVLRRL